MFSTLLAELRSDPAIWERCQRLFAIQAFPAKTTLLREGEVATHMYYVKTGCLRLWFNKNGKDVTFQFFFEDQPVSSLESFILGEPSPFSLETLEPTTVATITRRDWDEVYNLVPKLREQLMGFLLKRMGDYGRLFLSRIKDSPRERYEALVREHPEILQRIPQHYIASYIGITPVSLSRIRARKSRKKPGAS